MWSNKPFNYLNIFNKSWLQFRKSRTWLFYNALYCGGSQSFLPILDVPNMPLPCQRKKKEERRNCFMLAFSSLWPISQILRFLSHPWSYTLTLITLSDFNLNANFSHWLINSSKKCGQSLGSLNELMKVNENLPIAKSRFWPWISSQRLDSGTH